MEVRQTPRLGASIGAQHHASCQVIKHRNQKIDFIFLL